MFEVRNGNTIHYFTKKATTEQSQTSDKLKNTCLQRINKGV